MISDRESADKYSNSLGFSSIEDLSIEEFLSVMSFVSSKFNGFFIIKIDGERSVGNYTFSLNLIQEKNFAIRKDVDSIMDGIEFIFSQLYKNDLIVS